ncbi:hypothetical protein J9317_19790 [Metabacillus sp. KIGAM252]|uniref:Uncharacterized protein n=1 Tax=Metabacillus flavus TaxID=2823519 RepID=A0ABS5LJS5_9BACI|nr:hypothetical protein [Metabacillus flavus]MBS2970989.1 hypothetical protein [Metabacillus flavus]
MVAISSIEQLKTLQADLEKMKEEHPGLFTQWIHLVNLTRQLQFKHHFMGSLLLDEEPGRYFPSSAKKSVILLYQKEAEKLKDDPDFPELKRILSHYHDTGFSKISRLSLGHPPESLVGVSIA